MDVELADKNIIIWQKKSQIWQKVIQEVYKVQAEWI